MLSHLDHLVITTRDKDGCVDFYSRVLGMNVETFGNGRIALRFGAQKLNVHEFGQRTGAQWPIRSVYVRDPDMNLIELSERL